MNGSWPFSPGASINNKVPSTNDRVKASLISTDHCVVVKAEARYRHVHAHVLHLHIKSKCHVATDRTRSKNASTQLFHDVAFIAGGCHRAAR
jgi:hypothetical protein